MNQTLIEETMSHPPETSICDCKLCKEIREDIRRNRKLKMSLSSRELAERVMHCGTLELQPDEIEIDRAAALIETHVSEAVLKEAEWWAENIERWFGGHSEVTRERLAMIHRKLVELK